MQQLELCCTSPLHKASYLHGESTHSSNAIQLCLWFILLASMLSIMHLQSVRTQRHRGQRPGRLLKPTPSSCLLLLVRLRVSRGTCRTRTRRWTPPSGAFRWLWRHSQTSESNKMAKWGRGRSKYTVLPWNLKATSSFFIPTRKLPAQEATVKSHKASLPACELAT